MRRCKTGPVGRRVEVPLYCVLFALSIDLPSFLDYNTLLEHSFLMLMLYAQQFLSQSSGCSNAQDSSHQRNNAPHRTRLGSSSKRQCVSSIPNNSSLDSSTAQQRISVRNTVERTSLRSVRSSAKINVIHNSVTNIVAIYKRLLVNILQTSW